MVAALGLCDGGWAVLSSQAGAGSSRVNAEDQILRVQPWFKLIVFGYLASFMFDRSLLKISEEVEAALHEGHAVVALESTVIAHGLPRPLNLETARRLEQIVRAEGATPATIALIAGHIHVGLDAAQLEHIAQAHDVHKISTRDLAIAVARAWDGA